MNTLINDECRSARIRTCDECAQQDPRRAKENEQHHAKHADRSQAESSQVPRHCPRNHFGDIGQARDHDFETGPVELILESLHGVDRFPPDVVFYRGNDICGAVMLADKNVRPEGALQCVFDVFWPVALRPGVY